MQDVLCDSTAVDCPTYTALVPFGTIRRTEVWCASCMAWTDHIQHDIIALTYVPV